MNLVLVFGGVLAGAVVIDYGIKSVQEAHGASPAAVPGSAPASSSLSAGTVERLNSSQGSFASRLAADTGLDPRVIAGWLLAEEPASAAAAPNGANNWLNIGAFSGGGWAYGGSSVWAAPQQAADATAAFILGHPVNGVSPPAYGSVGIRRIAGTAGQSASSQVAAIQQSGWATSGYPDLPGLVGGL